MMAFESIKVSGHNGLTCAANELIVGEIGPNRRFCIEKVAS